MTARAWPFVASSQACAVFTHSPASWRRATYDPTVRAALLCGSALPRALGPQFVVSLSDPAPDLLSARDQLAAALSVIDLALARLRSAAVPVRQP